MGNSNQASLISFYFSLHLNPFILVLLGLSLHACGPGPSLHPGDWTAPTPHLSFQRYPITDGTITQSQDSVGFILLSGATDCSTVANKEFCSATLIGKKTVLTAAHCIIPNTSVFCLKIGGKNYPIASKIQHPQWDTLEVSNDIGIIKLTEAPPVRPSGPARNPPVSGTTIKLVGFGSISALEKATGEKRIAYNTLKRIWESRFSYSGTGNGVGNICQGDSGGPVFADEGDREVQIGVNSAGADECGLFAYATRVDAYYDWLVEVAGDDLAQGPKIFNASCEDNAECMSNMCGNFYGRRYCTEACNPSDSKCPENSSCLSLNNNSFNCSPLFEQENPWEGSCAISRISQRPTTVAFQNRGVGLLLLMLLIGLYHRNR